MADIKSFKIETPKNLNDIFSLDCFKYNEMKGLFKQIYEFLTRVGLKIGMQDFGEASRPRSRGDRERRRDVTIPALFGRGRCRRRRRVWDVAMEEGFLEAVDGVMNLPVCKWFMPIVAVDMPKAAAR